MIITGKFTWFNSDNVVDIADGMISVIQKDGLPFVDSLSFSKSQDFFRFREYQEGCEFVADNYEVFDPLNPLALRKVSFNRPALRAKCVTSVWYEGKRTVGYFYGNSDEID